MFLSFRVSKSSQRVAFNQIQAVDERSIRALFDAAVQAPSAVNQSRGRSRSCASRACSNQISREAKSHMLANMPPNLQSDHFRSRLTDPNFPIFYHAPVLILISASAQKIGRVHV